METAQRIGAYHDGELGPQERTAVEAHLAGCAECQARLRDIERLDGLLARLPEAEASARFNAALAGEIGRQERMTFAARSRILAYAAAACLLIFAGVMAVNRLQPASRLTARADLPNLHMLDNPDFLGIGKYSGGISSDLVVQVRLNSEGMEE